MGILQDNDHFPSILVFISMRRDATNSLRSMLSLLRHRGCPGPDAGKLIYNTSPKPLANETTAEHGNAGLRGRY